MLSKVAQKILSKDPVAEEEHRKGEEEEAKLGGGNYAGTSKQSNLKVRIAQLRCSPIPSPESSIRRLLELRHTPHHTESLQRATRYFQSDHCCTQPTFSAFI